MRVCIVQVAIMKYCPPGGGSVDGLLVVVWYLSTTSGSNDPRGTFGLSYSQTVGTSYFSACCTSFHIVSTVHVPHAQVKLERSDRPDDPFPAKLEYNF